MYQVGLSFDKDPQDLLIFDEGDSMLFETPHEFSICLANNPSICFTPTPGDKDNSLEKKIQEHMGFKILED